MSTLSLRKIKHDSSAVDNITLDSTGNIGVAASALSNSRIFLGGGNNQTALLFSNNSNGVVPPDVFGGAIDMNHSAGSCEVGFWNAYTANTLRSFAFYQRTGATTKNELMRIDTAGRVTMPYQPAFRVYNNATLTPTNGTTAIFNTVLFDRGSNYNTSTGRFTAPVAGVYAFFSTARPKTTLSPHEYEFRKNGSRDILQEHISSGSGATMTHQTVSMITYMNVNDYVTVQAVNNMQWDGGSYNGFSGFLVS